VFKVLYVFVVGEHQADEGKATGVCESDEGCPVFECEEGRGLWQGPGEVVFEHRGPGGLVLVPTVACEVVVRFVERCLTAAVLKGTAFTCVIATGGHLLHEIRRKQVEEYRGDGALYAQGRKHVAVDVAVGCVKGRVRDHRLVERVPAEKWVRSEHNGSKCLSDTTLARLRHRKQVS
jgi:hypothetical protein